MKITKDYLKQIIIEEIDRHVNEMATLFNPDKSDKEYIEVIRLDKDFGGRGRLGPHNMMASDMSKIDSKRSSELSDLLHKLLKKADSQPVPAKDFISREWEPQKNFRNRKVARKRPLYFAFKDVKSAEDWFGRKQLKQLIDIFGFELRKIKAKRAWISKSRMQVVFEPLTSLEDGEVIS
jgi:hypothetical protein